MKFSWTLAALLIAATVCGPARADRPDRLRPILDAIRHVETGGAADPAGAVGDGGKSRGPYQIGRLYHADALEYDPSIGGRYEDVRHRDYAERVMVAYWKRYCPDALKQGDAQVLSRVHNGGPAGARKKATLAYWHKVRDRLTGARECSR